MYEDIYHIKWGKISNTQRMIKQSIEHPYNGVYNQMEITFEEF